MEVLTARAMGFCFGVRDALAATLATDNPTDVTIHGELVHNESVQAQLAARGFAAVSERTRRDGVPSTARVLITAHGISDRERARLLGRNHRRCERVANADDPGYCSASSHPCGFQGPVTNVNQSRRR